MEDAYVINLKSSKDRWEKIQKDFQGSSIRLNRVEPVRLIIKGSTSEQRRIRMRSLALTFLKIIKMAKRRGLPNVLIFEDDCLPVKGFETLWFIIKQWLFKNPLEWDLYSGGTISATNPCFIGSLDGVQFYRPDRSDTAHWIYIQSRSYNRVIQKYKEELKKHVVTSDGTHSLLKHIISYPFVAYQQSKSSTLTLIKGTGKENTRFIESVERKVGQTRRVCKKRSSTTRKNYS